MGRIVAIASGDLLSTRPLNKYAIKLAKKQNPNVLFIGTASQDAQDYQDTFTKEYNKLGCEVKCLCLMSAPSEDTINDLLVWADIIYVGGGDTVFMMQMWKKYGVDKKLKEIYEKDTAVLTGISAGAICWFCCGHSDSQSFSKESEWEYCWADGLGIVPMAFCPHYNEEGRGSFDAMLLEKDIVGLAMENNTAFVESDGERYFIRSSKEVQAFLIQYQAEEMQKRSVEFKQI